MKKKIMTACILTMTAMSITACSGGKEQIAQTETAELQETIGGADGKTDIVVTDETTNADQGSGASAGDRNANEAGAAAATGKTISPVPSYIDMDNLDDITVAVSFEKGDAYLDNDGKLQLAVTVYDYDLYDMVDISRMEVGDTLAIDGEDVEVTSLETNDYGQVIVNGGLDAGGYVLATGEDTVYFEIGYSDAKSYYEVGQATIPVSDAFEFEDSSDPTSDPVTWYAGDFLDPNSAIEYTFTPHNTTITIEGGSVIRMDRIYTP